MAANTERLQKLLEHYRDRLHYLGDEGHDEELDYLQQILSSSLFQQYVTGGNTSEEMRKVAEASNVVLSGITAGSVEDERLSQAEKHKIQLARKKSLKALRNAVTPKNSPLLKKKWPRSNSTENTSLESERVNGTMTMENDVPHSSSGLLQSRHKDGPFLPKLVDSSPSPPAMNGIHPIKLTSRMDTRQTNGVHSTLLESKARNFSSSTSMLIERPSPPSDYHYVMRKKSSDSILSGSQPNIHQLNFDLNFADIDPFFHSTTVTSPGSNLAPEWKKHHPHLQAGMDPNISSGNAPPPLRPPPPYLPHLQRNEPTDTTPLRPPPPYPFVPQRRAKSYEKLLDSPDDLAPLPFVHPRIPPMTDGAITQDVPMAQSRKTRLVLCLEKGDEGLGFRVKGLKSEQRGELGLFVQDLLPGGLAERDGRLKRNDQIVSINGHSLERVPHNDAVKLLQSVRGTVELVIARDQHASLAPPSPPSLSPSKPWRQQWEASPATQSQTLPTDDSSDEGDRDEPSAEVGKEEEEANQHKIETIELPNEGQGFGFGVIPREDKRGIKVHSIVQGGIADKDGRLRQEDQLLQINEESVIHMRYEDVVAKLRLVSQSGRSIRLVVARVVSSRVEEESGVLPEINDSSDEEEFEVELHKSRGLGITIAGLVDTDTGEEVSGIYITSLNPSGAAAIDGRIQVGDRIVKVDGHPLRGLENMEAAAVLRNSGNPVKLVLGRRRRRVASSTVSPVISPSPPEPPSAQSHDQAGFHGNNIPTEAKVEADDTTLAVTSVMEEKASGNVPMENHTSEMVGLSPEEEQELVKKWSQLLGPEYQVKVDQVTKDEEGGLGIRMESTAELDDIGNPQIGSIHHVVQYVHAEGPVGRHGVLHEGDEILEVNGTELVGLQHNKATEVVKDMPTHVTFVVCRPLPKKDTAEPQLTGSETTDGGALTPPSESGERRGSTPDSIQALPLIEFPGLGDFARRFERQSWRERHEEERRRLKQRFEQRREEYERHIREQEEELLQQEKELKDRQLRQVEEEERRKADAEQRNSARSQTVEFDYSPYITTPPNTTFMLPMYIHSPDSARDSFATDSSASALSPVPGTGFWESEISEIDLEKGEEGLGFSILDFTDPHHPGDRVILVHSLVEDGVAQKDTRLKVGDKLVSVNGTSVVNHSLQFAVQQLVMVPLGGVVRLGVNHPVPASPEINSSPGSPLVFFMDTQIMAEDSAHNHNTLYNAASVGSIEKPLSDEGDVEKGEKEREKDGEEEEDASHLKKKKSSDSDDDDEPPPPYSKTDPQEDKFEGGEGGGETSPRSPAEPEQLPRTSEARKLVTESSSTSDSDSRSAASLSRVSSPIRGKTLSDLTRITPEDTACLQPPDSAIEAVIESQPESLSLSDTTLVNSQELGTMNLSPPTPEVGTQRSDELKLVLETRDGGRRPKRKGKRAAKDRVHSSQSREAATHLVLNSVQLQGTVSSQESNLEGLSPEMSDYGEHSNEAESEPREIKIRKGSLNLGMSLAADDKNACIVVKNVASNGAVRHDGRIRVGDRILKINGKSLDGVSLPKAKTVLKRASAKSEVLTITYVPVPQVQTYTMPSYGYKPSSRSVPGSNTSVRLYPSLQHQLATIRGTPLHDIAEQELTGGGQANIQMAPHAMLASHTQLSHNPQMMHQTSPPAPQWQQGVSPYQTPLPGTSNITTMQVTGSYLEQATTVGQVTGSYLEQATTVGQPLPPYVYLQQPPGMMAQTPPQPAYPQPPPPQPMAWNMQQQMAMGPPLSQASPMANWGVNVMHREPPQYDELMVQQQRVHAQTYQLPSSLQQQTQQHQMQQNNRMNKSQSESKFHSGMTQRPQVERRHNSQGLPSVIQPPAYKPFRLQQQRENSFEEQQRWSHELSHGDGVRARNTEMGKTHLVELVKDHTGSLGIHVGQLGGDGGPGGVMVASVLSSCQAFTRRKPKRGDQILEVNGIDLRHATQAEAINILNLASNPVRVLLQSQSERLRPAKFPPSHIIEDSPEHSHHNSWAIEEEEDAKLREEFPDVDGHLYEVKLNKGNSGLGLSIVANTNAQSVKGIVIMGIQLGGVADQSGRIKWGDMILKVNETCVIGMSQQQVQELLAKAPPVVRFVLVRQHTGIQQKHVTAGSDISLEGLAMVKAVQLRRDNDKGLGFTVSEGEQGGKTVVIVTKIVPGGPAEQGGQLQVGDQVLSVDGQNILGYSYEKVKHLLQQARSRGSVTLIIASHSSQHEGGMKGGGGGAGELQGRLPEGVKLRNKKKKPSSLKTHKRRPVSVDYDPSLQFSGRSLGTGGEARPQRNAPDEYRHHSNRNSHPLTDREVEQGFHHLNRHKDIIPGKEHDIVIFKGSEMLGVIIVGGLENFINGIYIQKVIPDSPAAKDGRLQSGDRILKVNNASMEDATREDALRALQLPSSFVHLTILRDPARAHKMTHSEDLTSSSSSPMAEVVELLKPERGGLGLLIWEQDDLPGVYVKEVVKNGAAYNDGRIQSGDKILAINGQDISNMGQDVVYRILQSCKGKVTLVVSHSTGLSPSPANQMDFNQPDKGPQPHHMLQGRPPPEYPYGPPLPPSHDRDPPPYSTASSSQVPIATRPPLQPISVYTNSPDYLSSLHQSSGPGAIYRGERRPHSPPPPAQEDSNTEPIKVIRLCRGPSGLGFTIVGGKGSTHGDLPIFIKRVFNEGAAGRDGRLRMGDQLLAVNGVSFENVTHQFAAETLKYLQGDVELTVLSTE